MKNLTYILVLLGCVFTLSNCKDKCIPEKIYIKDLHKYVPYTGAEILRFLHNNTDTQTFVGQGIERFYVDAKRQQDDGCYQQHESVRIRFVNTQTQAEIKMEYVYDISQGGNTLRLYYKGNSVGGIQYWTLKNKVEINLFLYDYVSYYSSSPDTLNYLAYRSAFYSGYSGILKFKYPSDTLTLLR